MLSSLPLRGGDANQTAASNATMGTALCRPEASLAISTMRYFRIFGSRRDVSFAHDIG